MDHLTTEHLRTLRAEGKAPCVSLYQPTHRHHPDNRQDPLRFRNLVGAAGESLQQGYAARDVEALLDPLQRLASDSRFWTRTQEGLAVFACPGTFEILRLQRAVPERVVVADSFHIKPLLRHLQSADRFQVLALTRERANVFEGNRDALDEQPLPDDFPATFEAAVPPARAERGTAIASTSAGVGSPRVLHGHAEGKDDIDTGKFFRAVDRAVEARFSKPSGLPLILAALPEHQAVFRRISRNPHLVADGVDGNPEVLQEAELREQVWRTLEPHYLARLEALVERYRTAAARQAGAADLSDVARAAAARRVGTLLVEADRVVSGILDRASGAIRPGPLESPHVEDMLDDLAELVLDHGGEVVVVPGERMPTTSGLAAIYRF